MDTWTKTCGPIRFDFAPYPSHSQRRFEETTTVSVEKEEPATAAPAARKPGDRARADRKPGGRSPWRDTEGIGGHDTEL